jgi:hypothetical protein
LVGLLLCVEWEAQARTICLGPELLAFAIAVPAPRGSAARDEKMPLFAAAPAKLRLVREHAHGVRGVAELQQPLAPAGRKRQ